jgi:penicillin-insensitive murein endopeptidase
MGDHGMNRAIALAALITASMWLVPSAGIAGEPSKPPVDAPRQAGPATPPALPNASPGNPPASNSAAAARAVPAKEIFGAASNPAPLTARAVGFYARGCLAGAVPVPIDGDSWQVMRLSRNRNWGHPDLVALVERLARDSAAKDGWPGLLVGDISQPRGGPMLTGHSSHQIGLDADVWLTPMPERRLTATERETLGATSMLGRDGIDVDPRIFTPRHSALIRRAASYPQVERVLVHAGIKKAMCEEKGVDRANFHKIRPYWGHHYHMHIRIGCPKGSTTCKGQAPTPGNDGCGAEVDHWIALLRNPPKPKPPTRPSVPKPPMTLDDLPPECRAIAVAQPKPAASAGNR